MRCDSSRLPPWTIENVRITGGIIENYRCIACLLILFQCVTDIAFWTSNRGRIHINLVSALAALVYDTLLQFSLEASIPPFSLCNCSDNIQINYIWRCDLKQIVTICQWLTLFAIYLPLQVQNGRFPKCSTSSFAITPSSYPRKLFESLQLTDLLAELAPFFIRILFIGTTRFSLPPFNTLNKV